MRRHSTVGSLWVVIHGLAACGGGSPPDDAARGAEAGDAAMNAVDAVDAARDAVTVGLDADAAPDAGLDDAARIDAPVADVQTADTRAADTGAADTGVGTAPVPTGVGGHWSLIFDDEMNGTALDTTKWHTGWFGTGITGGVSSTEDDCYDPMQVTEAGGELDLNLVARHITCNGATRNYATGFVSTNGLFSYTYGFVEARIWLPGSGSTIADWPSFWQDGQSWPADGELDVLEGLGGSACAHWHGPTGAGAGYGPNGGSGCASGVFTGGWHTFGAEWAAGIVTWYYDGVSIGCVESTGTACGGASHDATITSSPQYLILGLGATSPAVAPATQRVDYVRVWQH